jgi:hypothetical protein
MRADALKEGAGVGVKPVEVLLCLGGVIGGEGARRSTGGRWGRGGEEGEIGVGVDGGEGLSDSEEDAVEVPGEGVLDAAAELLAAEAQLLEPEVGADVDGEGAILPGAGASAAGEVLADEGGPGGLEQLDVDDVRVGLLGAVLEDGADHIVEHGASRGCGFRGGAARRGV